VEHHWEELLLPQCPLWQGGKVGERSVIGHSGYAGKGDAGNNFRLVRRPERAG